MSSTKDPSKLASTAPAGTTTVSTTATPGTLTSAPGLAVTGSDARSLALVALAAMSLGGLALLLTRRPPGR